MIRENLKVAESRQKSYADKRRMDLSFKIGDFVHLKVSLMRGTQITIRRMKLPRSTKKSLEQIILSYSQVLLESRGRDPSKGGG
jgi:hypothetical protein